MSTQSDNNTDGQSGRVKRLKLDHNDYERSAGNYEDRIFNNELILNCILKQLTPKQLKSVSRVNKTWNNRCTKLIRLTNSKLEDLFLIFGVSQFMKKNKDRYWKITLVKDVENFEKLKEEIVDHFENQVKSVPSIALLFHTFRRINQKHYSAFVNNKLINLLPNDCSILNLSTNDCGIIGNLPNDEHSIETLQENRFISGISYVLIPDLSMYDCKIIPIKTTQTDLCKYLSEEKIAEHKIKGVIAFVKFYQDKSPDLSILRELIDVQTNRIALGGILVENIDIDANFNQARTLAKSDFAGLIFCGDNVNCASLVIKTNCKKEVKKLLINFKNDLKFDWKKENSELMAFLFACTGRSFNVYDDLNQESDLVKEQFPNVKLYGLFGLGEIGWNSSPTEPSIENREELIHYFTSILVLVHISKK